MRSVFRIGAVTHLSIIVSYIVLCGAGGIQTLRAQAIPALNDQLLQDASVVQAKSGKIKYLKETAPPYEIAPYTGERYQDTVPDTYDISERARQAIIGLTCPMAADPSLDYEIYFGFDGKHSYSDICRVKYFESLPLMRIISGSDVHSNVDRIWTDGILKSIGPDGLYYICSQGRPWFQSPEMAIWVPHVIWPDGTITTSKGQNLQVVTNPVMLGRVIGTLTLYYERDHNPLWKDTAQKMVDRVAELAIEKDDYAYLPDGFLVPNAKVPPDAPMPTDILSSEFGGRMIQGLTQFYRATGYQPARDLAGKFVNYMRYHSQYYLPDGRFFNGAQYNYVGGHMHGHTQVLLAMADYGMATHDADLLSFVRGGFEYGMSQGGEVSGWFPESVMPNYKNCEPCGVADMCALAVKLSEAGVGDYYDDVDGWIRNVYSDFQNPQYGFFAPGCCNGNGTRTIYYLWEAMLQHSNDQLRINLLMNRASPWADVYSYIPYQGRVEVKVKQDCDSVLIRAPKWIQTGSSEIACLIDGNPQGFAWEGRYLNVGKMTAGQKLTMMFPMDVRTVHEMWAGDDWTFTVKDGSITAYTVTPENHGTNFPIPHKNRFPDGPAPMHQVTRFVTNQQIYW